MEIFVPPLSEQNRIVSELEELLSELDKGIEYLRTAQEQLKVYRQSVLKNAFEGKLTEQWREDCADQIGKADQLLERIHQERENAINRSKMSGKKQSKLGKRMAKRAKNLASLQCF